MKQYPNSNINVQWKPAHMVNSGCQFSTKTKDGSKTCSAYIRWWGMFMRCYNPANPGYSQYGAKGVVVSKEWGNYQDFAQWYYDTCSLLGIDPENNNYQLDKDNGLVPEYSPKVCKLIPVSDNVAKANSKSHWYINPNGDVVEIINLNKFCREHGLSRKQMYRLRDGTCESHRGWRLYV